MLKKAVGLTILVSLALIGTALAQPPMDPAARTSAPGVQRGTPSPGHGWRMGQGMRGGSGMGWGLGPGRMAIWKDKELLKKAGISEAQATKLREMHFQNQMDRIKIGSDLRIKQLEMAELMSADKPDDAKIMAKAKEISSLREKLYLQNVQRRLAMRKLITPEQMDKLRDALRGGRTVIEKRMEMRFGGSPDFMGPGSGMGYSDTPLPEASDPDGSY